MALQTCLPLLPQDGGHGYQFLAPLPSPPLPSRPCPGLPAFLPQNLVQSKTVPSPFWATHLCEPGLGSRVTGAQGELARAGRQLSLAWTPFLETRNPEQSVVEATRPGGVRACVFGRLSCSGLCVPPGVWREALAWASNDGQACRWLFLCVGPAPSEEGGFSV